MIVATSQMILRAHFARVNDRRTEKDVALRLVGVKCVILVADGIVLFSNASLQIFRIEEKSAQIRKTLFVIGRGLRNDACVGCDRDTAWKR